MEGNRLQKENIMGTLPVNRLMITMAWPMIISMFIQGLYNVVDSIFVSYVSPDAFVALSIVYPVQMLLVSVNVGIGVGINALLSRRLGEQRYEEANNVAAHGYALYMFLGILYAVLGLLISRPFMEAFSETPAVIEYGTIYFRIVTAFSMGVCVQFAGERMMQATGNPLGHMYIQALGAIVNLILDPIFIFGLFGFPKLGIIGAGLATVTGQWCGAILGLYLVRKKVKQIHISLRKFRPSWEIIQPILRVGAPATVVQSLATFMSLALNKILGSYSEDYVAVLGAYFKVQNFAFMVAYGIGNAVVPIISFNCGARAQARVEGTVRAAMVLVVASMLVATAFLLTAPELLMKLFHMTPSAAAIGVPALRIVCLSFLPAGISLVCSYAFQATGCNSYSLGTALLRQIILLLPLVTVLAQIDPLFSWWAFPATEGFCCVVSLLLYKAAHKKKIATLGG